jgi:hypothetical protein
MSQDLLSRDSVLTNLGNHTGSALESRLQHEVCADLLPRRKPIQLVNKRFCGGRNSHMGVGNFTVCDHTPVEFFCGVFVLRYG